MEFKKGKRVEFKKGDVVKCPSIWGDKYKFTIVGLFGNDYSPMAVCHMNGKPETPSNICNIDKRNLVLIGAIKRPMSKVMTSALERLAKRGIPEAIRELEIRKQK